MRTLWCRLCSTGYASVGGDVPKTCPACLEPAKWSTLAPITADRPKTPYELTYNDKRFLKSLRIAWREEGPSAIAEDDGA